MTKFRLANLNDLNDIYAIIEGAKALLKQRGLSQWQSGSPSYDQIKNDIINEESFVYLLDETIVGTVCLSFNKDPNYDVIDGRWQNADDPYLVIHRLATKEGYYNQNIASIIFQESVNYAKSNKVNQLRIDTHKDNKQMLHLINKFNFEYCGIVDVIDKIDSKRKAYQLFINL